MSDAVNPDHYKKGGIETFDILKAKMEPDAYEGYLIGCIMKYLIRYKDKNGGEDIRKAARYMEQLVKEYTHGDVKTPEPPFKPGDKVMRKNKVTFSNDAKIVTVSHIAVDGKVWLAETASYIEAKDLEHAPIPQPKMPSKPKKGINDLCQAAFSNAQDKGWHDEKRSFGDVIALIHSELSEALEDYRNGKGIGVVWHEDGGKPCGIPSELADVVIRVFDFCGSKGIDLEGMINEKMAYNATRPARHGGKKL